MPNGRPHVLVIGSAEHTAYASAALNHPLIDVESADREKRIVAALTGQAFDLAIVGGNVGQRGPLVLCEAVRLRQDLPVLVMVGDETDPAALHEHQSRHIEGVQYLDCRGKWGNGSPSVDVGSMLRSQALDILHVPEDREAAREWVEVVEGVAQEEQSTEAAPVMEVDEVEVVEAAVDGPPPLLQQLNEDDVGFADRVIERTRGVDFRAEDAPATAAADAADAKTVQLRQRVRTLEKQLARLAFVYAARRAQFETSEQAMAELDAEKQRLEKDLSHRTQKGAAGDQAVADLEREREDLRGRLRTALEDVARLKNEIDDAARTRMEQEKTFKQMLTQAQEAFGDLRDQSAKAIASQEAQTNAHAQQAQEAQARLSQLTAELDAARVRYDRMVEETRERERVMAAEHNQRVEEVMSERQGFLNEKNTLASDLNAARSELSVAVQSVEDRRAAEAQLREELERVRVQMKHAEVEFAETQASWSEKVDKLKASAGTFRDAYQEREAKLSESEQEREVLNTKLTERDEAFERLERTQRELVEGVTDPLAGHITTIEEIAQSTEKRLEDQVGLLDKMRKRLERQGEALDRVTESIAQRQAADGQQINVGQIVQWFFARPARWGAVAGVIVAVAVAFVVLAVFSGGDAVVSSERSVGTAAPVAAAAADVDTAPAAVTAVVNDAPALEEEVDAGELADEEVEETGEAAAEPPEEEIDPASEGPSEGAAPEVAAAPGGSEKERKALRKELMKAYGKKKYGKAAELGIELRDAFRLDWESQWTLAEALRKSQQLDEAIATYESFVDENPDNSLSQEALFNAGTLAYKQGEKAQARAFFERITGRKYAKKAKPLLKKLK